MEQSSSIAHVRTRVQLLPLEPTMPSHCRVGAPRPQSMPQAHRRSLHIWQGFDFVFIEFMLLIVESI